MTRSVVTICPSATANQATLPPHQHTDSCVGTRASSLRCSRSGWSKNEVWKVFTNTGCTPQAPELARLSQGISKMADTPVILVQAATCPFMLNCNGRSVVPVTQIDVSETRPLHPPHATRHPPHASTMEGSYGYQTATATRGRHSKQQHGPASSARSGRGAREVG